MTVRHGSEDENESNEHRHIERGQAVLTLGTVDKLVAVMLALGTIVFSVGGNYMITNYRLTALEQRADKEEVKQEAAQTAFNDNQLKTDIKLSEMDGKLNNLVEQVTRLGRWANTSFDTRKEAGSLDNANPNPFANK